MADFRQKRFPGKSASAFRKDISSSEDRDESIKSFHSPRSLKGRRNTGRESEGGPGGGLSCEQTRHTSSSVSCVQLGTWAVGWRLAPLMKTRAAQTHVSVLTAAAHPAGRLCFPGTGGTWGECDLISAGSRGHQHAVPPAVPVSWIPVQVLLCKTPKARLHLLSLLRTWAEQGPE